MTDHERQMIEAYIPHERDASLGFMEYYTLDDNNRVQKVYVCDLCPDFLNDRTTYGVRYAGTGKRYGTSWHEYGKTIMEDLYDNKQDCRDQTHCMYGRWERLRDLQEAKSEQND